MTEPVETPSPAPPAWIAAATRAGAELGLGSAFSGMDAAAWDRVRVRAAEILAAQGDPPPPDWARMLARALGRTDSVDDRAILARDEADTVLAEKGEVFAPEDDA